MLQSLAVQACSLALRMRGDVGAAGRGDEECFMTGSSRVYSISFRKGYVGCFWQMAKHKPLPALVMPYAISEGSEGVGGRGSLLT